MEESNMISRRVFLKTIGAAGLISTGGLVWRAIDQYVLNPNEGPGYLAWQEWQRNDLDGLNGLILAANLASSPHNTQPWLFRVTSNRIEVYADTQRNLGSFDPYLRELYIGVGCAIENIVTAAPRFGFRTNIKFNGNSSDNHVATVFLEHTEKRSTALATAIGQRHTNRGPYRTDQDVPDDIRQSFLNLVNDPAIKLSLFNSDSLEGKSFANATVDVTKQFTGDAEMVADSAKWFRHSKQEIDSFRDGISARTSGLSTFQTAMAQILPPLPAQVEHQYWVDQTENVHCKATAVYGLIFVQNLYDRLNSLNAGRLWQRIQLIATLESLAFQPLNQLPEKVDREKQLGLMATTAALVSQITKASDQYLTFAFRAGYPTQTANPSFRRPVSDILLT
jgi:hypothetical protein